MSQDFQTPVLTLEPIGVIRSQFKVKFDAPSQPLATAEENIIELKAHMNFEQALLDLQGFERIWLLWWFHRNSHWKPMVLPPRGQAQRRGLFATRSPHRPNPLGLSCVKLLRIEGRNLVVGPTDLIDQTPILDIKPYIPRIDAFPEAHSGWLELLEESYNQPQQYQVEMSPRACEQTEWLKQRWQIDFVSRAQQILAQDPSPHRTRRIKPFGSNLFRMGCGAWRVFFSVAGQTVRIEALSNGYALNYLENPRYDRINDRLAQLDFLKTFGPQP